MFLVSTSKVKSYTIDFYRLFYCCIVTPLSQARGRVEISQTCLTPPHNLCACPKSGACSLVVVVVFVFLCFFLFFVHYKLAVYCLLWIASHFIFWGLLQLTVKCGLLPIIEGFMVTCRCLICFDFLVYDGWLSH